MNDSEIREAVEILKGLICLTPNIRETEYVSRDMAIDAGDLSLEGSVYKEGTYEQCGGCEVCLLQQKLTPFLQSYLDIKGLPEDKFIIETNKSPKSDLINDCEVRREGFNQALHLCKLAYLKRENEIKERCSVEKLEKIIQDFERYLYESTVEGNIKGVDSDSFYDLAQAIHKEIFNPTIGGGR